MTPTQSARNNCSGPERGKRPKELEVPPSGLSPEEHLRRYGLSVDGVYQEVCDFLEMRDVPDVRLMTVEALREFAAKGRVLRRELKQRMGADLRKSPAHVEKHVTGYFATCIMRCPLFSRSLQVSEETIREQELSEAVLESVIAQMQLFSSQTTTAA